MFLGRARELEAIGALLDGARNGAGGALLLQGEPGIGKSTLLAHAGGLAAGMGVRAIAGVEAEADLPFAGLAEILVPHRELIDGLPRVQASAVRTALALGEEPAATADAVATLQGTLSLLAAAAAERPQLLLIDDLPWLDPPTRDAVAFVARRASELPLALVVAQRPCAEPVPPGMTTLEVTGLDRADSLELLGGVGLAANVANRVAAAAAGNPLALQEIPRELSGPQRQGSAPLTAPLPAGATLAGVYESRLAALPAEARQALLLAAASEATDRDALARALEAGGSGIANLAPAEDAGLVRLEAGAVAFTHPLVRSAAYHGASAAERRAAHRALADTAGGASAAWHRAAAAEGPDLEVAEQLAAVAAEAAARGAPGSAADAFERAVQAAPEGPERYGWALGAGYAALAAGQVDRARRLLDALLPTVTDPLARADVQRVRAGAMMLSGDPIESQTLLLAEAERIGERDPTRRAALLMDAGVAQMASGDMSGLVAVAEGALEAARRAGDPDPLLPAVMLAEALAVQGDHERAAAIVARLEQPDTAAVTANPEVLAVAGLCFMWLEQYDRAGEWLDHLIADARAAGAVRALPMPLSVRACLDIRRGDLARAETQAREAVAIAEVAAAGFVQTFALSTLATVLGWRGDAGPCRSMASRALEIEASLGMNGTRAFTELALTTLHLGLGETAAAAEHAARGIETGAAYGMRDPSFLQDGANPVEALVREGREDEALASMARLKAGAELTGGAWPRAALERCRGLLAPENEFDAHFAAALELHDAGVAMPLERARTLLCFGERLRRAKRRADARGPLSEAERAFDRAGATAWAERARKEIGATTPRRSSGAAADNGMDLDLLTHREAEVCRLVADGAQNREVAAALFMSPRTVEYHLGNAYRKLGVRSRTELAGRFTR